MQVYLNLFSQYVFSILHYRACVIEFLEFNIKIENSRRVRLYQRLLDQIKLMAIQFCIKLSYTYSILIPIQFVPTLRFLKGYIYNISSIIFCQMLYCNRMKTLNSFQEEIQYFVIIFAHFLRYFLKYVNNLQLLKCCVTTLISKTFIT